MKSETAETPRVFQTPLLTPVGKPATAFEIETETDADLSLHRVEPLIQLAAQIEILSDLRSRLQFMQREIRYLLKVDQ